MRRLSWSWCVALGAAVMLAGACGPALAARLGNPDMYSETAQIAQPYSPLFDLSVNPSQWPGLIVRDQRSELDRDANGMIALTSVYQSSGAVRNQALVWSDDSGTLGGQSRMESLTGTQTYCGAFTHSKWAQSFRRDSANASMTITLTRAELYAGGVFSQGRVEFTFEAKALDSTTTLFSARHAAGLRVTAGNPSTFEQVIETTMPMTQTDPSGQGRERVLTFATDTIAVDLAAVPLGGEFTLAMDLVTEAAFQFGEVVRFRAEIGSPGTMTGGVQLDVAGLTPTDHPLGGPVVSVVPGVRPGLLALSPPHPNPARGAVRMALELPAGGDVAVELFDPGGRRIATLARGRHAAGRHVVHWDGRVAGGREAEPGVYHVRASVAGGTVTRRIVRVSGGR